MRWHWICPIFETFAMLQRTREIDQTSSNSRYLAAVKSIRLLLGLNAADSLVNASDLSNSWAII